MIEELLKEFHVPQPVLRHCEKVAEVCKFIGSKIPGVDLDLLHKAAMLHDLVRICDFTVWNPENIPGDYSAETKGAWEEIRKKYSGKSHEEAAYEVLKERGYEQVAKLIRSHRFENILKKDFETWEEKILYYADKRVEMDQVVSLDHRLKEGKKRNANTPERQKISDLVRPKVFELEKEICSAADIKPEDIS